MPNKEIIATLEKPYTENQRMDFIVEYNHNQGCEIETVEVETSEDEEAPQPTFQAFKMVATEDELINARKQTFYTQFIVTSLGNYRLEPKGYANAQQAMDVTNTMATALGGLTEQLTNLVIFYETPDFTKEEECTEEWLVAHQIKPDVMTLVEWQKFYLEFCQLYAMQQYKTTVNGGTNENTTDTEQSTGIPNEMETKATDELNIN